MREMFVSELVREMLGPRRGVNGIRETLDRSPMAEFMTGILSPIMAGMGTAMHGIGRGMMGMQMPRY